MNVDFSRFGVCCEQLPETFIVVVAAVVFELEAKTNDDATSWRK